MKTFLFDLTKCVGCYACQIGCKDEHCEQAWMPYAEAQPETGQFWMRVDEKERGHRPHVKVTYIPVPCQHCADAPCKKAAKDDAVYTREDGLVIIDPVKAKGQKAIKDACPYGAVYWNDALDIPQKCTGCAHLIDEGDTITVPRCYDNCVHGAIQWGEEDELDLEGAERLHPEYGTSPQVWYKGLPKKFIAGRVYDPAEKEVVEGATVTATNGTETFTAETNWIGDFWLRGLPNDDFTVTIEAAGKKKELAVSTKTEDIGLGDIPLD